MSKQCPTEITEITERLRIVGAKISVLSVLSVGLKLSICMSKQCPTEITEITERLRIVGAKISVLSVLSVGLKLSICMSKLNHTNLTDWHTDFLRYLCAPPPKTLPNSPQSWPKRPKTLPRRPKKAETLPKTLPNSRPTELRFRRAFFVPTFAPVRTTTAMDARRKSNRNNKPSKKTLKTWERS